jgi:hypothetical protein
LEKKVQTKDEVLAELMAEHIASKKPFGVRALYDGSYNEPCPVKTEADSGGSNHAEG